MMGRRRIAAGRGRVLVAAVLALVVAGALVAALGSSKSSDAVAHRATETAGVGIADSYASAPTAANGVSGVSADIAPAGGGSKQIGPVPPGGGGSTPVPGSPKIVRTGELRVNVGKSGFDAAFDRVASIAAANGGFIAGSSTSTVNKARAGELTVRIPSDRFDGARRDLAALGKVEYQALRGEDVSGQLVDYGARLTSLNAQEEALRGLVGKATAVGEVLQVQNSLFDVRQQIEQLTAQKQNLEQSASLATIQVSMFEPGAGFEVQPVESDKGLAHAVRRSVDGAVAVVGGTIVVVGWAIPIVVLVLVVWGASRLFRRRPPTARPTATDSTAPATP